MTGDPHQTTGATQYNEVINLEVRRLVMQAGPFPYSLHMDYQGDREVRAVTTRPQ
jgi:hypothetical protein